MATASPPVWNLAAAIQTIRIDGAALWTLEAGHAMAVSGGMWLGAALSAVVVLLMLLPLPYVRQGCRLFAAMAIEGGVPTSSVPPTLCDPLRDCPGGSPWNASSTVRPQIAAAMRCWSWASMRFARSTKCSDVCQALERHAIDPQDLVIELAESGAMRNPELSMMLLRKLTSLGVRISLDDFGVGYSSLSHLKRFPIHELKIDRSFIAAITDSAEDLAIVNAIVALAQAADLRVVAEGVETVEQQAALAQMGCDVVQGYLLSRPVRPEEIPAIVTRCNASAAAFA